MPFIDGSCQYEPGQRFDNVVRNDVHQVIEDVWDWARIRNGLLILYLHFTPRVLLCFVFFLNFLFFFLV